MTDLNSHWLHDACVTACDWLRRDEEERGSLAVVGCRSGREFDTRLKL